MFLIVYSTRHCWRLHKIRFVFYSGFLTHSFSFSISIFYSNNINLPQIFIIKQTVHIQDGFQITRSVNRLHPDVFHCLLFPRSCKGPHASFLPFLLDFFFPSRIIFLTSSRFLACFPPFSISTQFSYLFPVFAQFSVRRSTLPSSPHHWLHQLFS